MSAYPVESSLQNGTYPWVTPSSLGQKSWPPGYQASLTDLFLKKNPLHFGTGISQLAAASSYIEKMSSLNDHVQKCPHPDAKDKPHPCEVCQQYFSLYNSLKSDGACSSTSNYSLGGASNTNRPVSAPPERKQLQPPLQPPISGSIDPNNLSKEEQLLPQPPSLPSREQNDPPYHEENQSIRRSHPAPTKNFMCPVCYKYFTQKGNLKTHMMIHTGEKPFSCQVCGKSFTQKGNVDTHMKIHTGEKEFGCNTCGKRFTQKGNLKTHIRSVHAKEKPFACGVCGKCFSQKGNMQTHMRTHNKDDRFPCSLCGKTFSQKGNLKTHMHRHTGQVPSRRYGSQGGSHSCETTPNRSYDLSGTTPFVPYNFHKSSTASKVSSESPLPPSTSNQPMESNGQTLRNIQSPPHSQVIKPIPESHPHMRTSPLSQISSGAQSSSLPQFFHRAPPPIEAHSNMDQKLPTMPQHQEFSSPSPPDIMNHPPDHLPKPSTHSHQPLSTHFQGSMIPSVMHSPPPHPHVSRINSPPPHTQFGQLAISESEGRPFYSAPPTPVPASFAHSPRWLPHGYQRHYNNFQPPSSYGPITQHPTPLSRLALLSSNSMAHHSSSPVDKQHFGANSAHNQHQEPPYHQSESPDFSQLLG
ncbi:zinc finger protein squeeze-like [Limulus polyphemus]|uniref:Zinc finger protein squeeze-like n=1 Tax=Limulus polyphemus TaxID=6850 RepID=A0ABM1BTS1_LIMPO|nr:zinc finger protein squeeze-like [Limulus polyphemus]